MPQQMTQRTVHCTFCGSVEVTPFPGIMTRAPIQTSCCHKCSIFKGLKVGMQVEANAMERDPAQLSRNQRLLQNGLEENPIYTISQIRCYPHFTEVVLQERNRNETFNAVIFTPLGFTKEKQ